MRQKEFVKQVYYLQEKVLLDFLPTDDKYQEVIYEANLVLQELQKEEDWSWLREQYVLGSMNCNPGDIPEFDLPEWAYKVSTLHKDCVHLHHCIPFSETGYDQLRWQSVPFGSIGMASSVAHRPYTGFVTNTVDPELRAVIIGRTITFTRPPNPFERDTIAITDMQARIPLMRTASDIEAIFENDEDVSDDDINELIEETAHDEVLLEIPDPNYVITRTAALHAQGSPPAQSRAMDLSDQAQKLLSAMRANDAAATDADYIEWEKPISYIEVV